MELSESLDRRTVTARFRRPATADCRDSLFLPSFCDIGLVFVVVVTAQLLAFALVLAAGWTGFWNRLAVTSLFIQWIVLSGAMLLCLARPLLVGFSNSAAALISYLLLLLVTTLIAELTYRTVLVHSASSVGIEHAEFVLRSLGISAIVSALVLRYLYVKHQWQQQIEAEAQARIQALQARIRPHFLFNSMNTIAELTRTDPVRAELAVQDLADLFRATLRDVSERVTLEQELEVARRYLRMEGLRLGDRLKLDWHTDGLPLQRKVPALILQPLLENAVYHGIEPRAEGGVISVVGRVDGPLIRITVRNPKASARPASHRKGNQIALANIRQRLRLVFGQRSGVAVNEGAESVDVTLYFPRERAS